MLGAGAFGLSIAWVCVQRGARVRVIDPNGVAAGSSGGIVGALAPHTPENWNDKKQFQLESLLMAGRFWAEVEDASGTRRRIFGLFAALSYDGGKTWPRIRVVGSDPETPQTVESMNGQSYELSRSQGEPRGYLTATQGANGVIHLISSWNHYAFNLKWLETPPPPE